jgi:hypothetical protein
MFVAPVAKKQAPLDAIAGQILVMTQLVSSGLGVARSGRLGFVITDGSI